MADPPVACEEGIELVLCPLEELNKWILAGRIGTCPRPGRDPSGHVAKPANAKDGTLRRMTVNYNNLERFAGGRPVDVCVVGGAGHVVPWRSWPTATKPCRAIDLNDKALATISQGKIPFLEKGAEPILAQPLPRRRSLALTSDTCWLQRGKTIITPIGTPVDEFLNPDFKCFLWVEASLPYLTDEQTLILRTPPSIRARPTGCSNSFPANGGRLHLSSGFCRVTPHRGVAAVAADHIQRHDPRRRGGSGRLFGLIAPNIVEMQPMEARILSSSSPMSTATSSLPWRTSST